MNQQEREAVADERSRALIELVRSRLPLTAHVAGTADAWQLVGPALIARQVGTMEAIFALRPLDREADPFAWLAADPGRERHRRFLKSDLRRRIQIAKDRRKLKHKGVQIDVASEAQQQDFEQRLTDLP